jgi:hypothetical protein
MENWFSFVNGSTGPYGISSHLHQYLNYRPLWAEVKGVIHSCKKDANYSIDSTIDTLTPKLFIYFIYAKRTNREIASRRKGKESS